VEAATEPLATRPNSTIDGVFIRLGPNGALGADEHQWILYRSDMRSPSSTRRS
jgi:hypothetical protein